MMKRLLVLCALCSGCDLYWGGGGGDDVVCTDVYPGGGAAQELRNPDTGQCTNSGGGGYCCGGGCYTEDDAPAVPALDWAVCYGMCEGLTESACLAQPRCHAAYLDNWLADQAGPSFYQCWDVAPFGAVMGANCANLDAQGCSQQDDCSAVYEGNGSPQKFEQCIAEGSWCDLACPDGAHCEQQCPCDALMGCGACNPTCVPDITCASIDCGPGYQCVEQCDVAVVGCQATCVPIDPVACEQLPTESDCIERMDCNPVYTGSSCTCNASGCTCQVLTYSHCESGTF
jgi:hypothetical protein